MFNKSKVNILEGKSPLIIVNTNFRNQIDNKPTLEGGSNGGVVAMEV